MVPVLFWRRTLTFWDGLSQVKTLPTSKWACPGHHIGVSHLPRELVKARGLDVALGLWIPETGERLTPSGELPVDQYGRVRLEVDD